MKHKREGRIFIAQNRIMLSSTGSGVGKTTMTLALLSVLCRRNLQIQSFKCGCDYIDPMFHKHITGRNTYQADPYFLDREQLQALFLHACDPENKKNNHRKINKTLDLSVFEGAMGYYDGIAGTPHASAWTVSDWLSVPVLLVVSPDGMGCSVGAVCKGFQDFRTPNQIRGVLLNRIRPGMYTYYKKIIESETALQVCGYLPDLPELKLKSRHLGLWTAPEIANLDQKLDQLAAMASQTLELEQILKLAGTAPKITKNFETIFKNKLKYKIRIGVAKDKAFCFYYTENLELLESYGAELVYFSPVSDKKLPEHLDGLYFGGGYPELYLSELSGNLDFIRSLKAASQNKIPIFAECGGFLYLLEKFGEYELAGLLSGNAEFTDHLCRFGYVNLTAQENSILGNIGIQVKAHEFHYADSTNNGTAFLAERPSGSNWNAIRNTSNILAGFPHLYFLSNPEIAENFCNACRKFHERQVLC
ncbi:MAG: cobyrinate a,c-diamide synthase [Oscillospiraceae bacterium]|nr:cobyrinate a,c-diamide synthase [Oscillospiraceae bacterium]